MLLSVLFSTDATVRAFNFCPRISFSTLSASPWSASLTKLFTSLLIWRFVRLATWRFTDASSSIISGSWDGAGRHRQSSPPVPDTYISPFSAHCARHSAIPWALLISASAGSVLFHDSHNTSIPFSPTVIAPAPSLQNRPFIYSSYASWPPTSGVSSTSHITVCVTKPAPWARFGKTAITPIKTPYKNFILCPLRIIMTQIHMKIHARLIKFTKHLILLNFSS